ncbi:MAG: DUF3833 domain-containing protein [Marinosulfonomonas sp.]
MFEFFLFAASVALVWFFMRNRVGFRSQKPQDFDGTLPAFDIRTHLSGPIDCEGVIYGPTGRVASSFVAKMNGDWRGASGTLSEDFTYSGGSVQHRKWNLSLGNDGRFTATADDILGTAKGVQNGKSVRMEYTIRLPEGSGGHVLSVTDWMYLMDNGNIINRSEMRKFGFKVAELVATMRPTTA